MRLSYRFGLYLSFIIIVITPILLTFILFKTLLQKTAENEFYAQAERVGRGIREEISKRSANLLLQAGKYSRDEQISSYLTSPDRSRLESRLIELFNYSNLDLLEIGDASGVVLARGHHPGEYGEGKASQEIIGNALGGIPNADIEYGASGIALRAVSPIRMTTGEMLGTFMTGILLNKDFFDIYKDITGFNIALFQGSSLIASTSGTLLAWIPPGGESNPPGENLESLQVNFALNGDEMWGIYLPVYHSTGEMFGGLLLWQDSDTIMRSLRINQLTLTYTFIFAIILSITLAVFLSRNFSAPLKKMLPVMDRVSQGNLDTDIPQLKWAEFRELSAHFRNMIAELQKSRQKIAKAQRQLLVAGKLAALGKVTAELAHEIRNPLNSMEITLRLLKEDVRERIGDNVDIEDSIETLRSEIRRLKQTIKDFVEAGGEITLHKKMVNIADELRETIKLAQPQIELLGINVDLDIENTAPIPLDSNRLHQAVLNIILNACQSMKPGGNLMFRGEETINNYTIIIRDSGAGMTAEEKDKIFDFPCSAKPEGMGCGLAYVLRIMQAHNGEFDIESQPGVGTTVRLSFPRKASGKKS